MKKVRLIKAVYFIWLAAPMTFFAIYALYGLPHVIWSYDWRDDGQGFSKIHQRHYTRCTFLGPTGRVTIYPKDGHCGWVLFHKRVEDSL